MFSIHRFRLVPAHSLYGILLLLLPGTTVAQSPSPVQEHQLDEQALVRLLYEGQNDPDFEGEVRFLRGVPLISRAPNTRPESQYYTSLILHARHVGEILFHAKIQQLFTQTVLEDDQSRKLSGRLRMQAAYAVLHRVLGMGDDSTTSPVGTGRPDKVPNPVDEAHAQQHTHDRLRYAPMRVGFSPTHLEVTTGLHILMNIDARLRRSPEQHAAILDAIGTTGIRWRVYDREAVNHEKCKRFLSLSIPFVAHRGEHELLVCGYAIYDGVTYLMGFDLSKIERRVSLGGGSGGMSYSQYLKRRDEVKARGGNPIIELDPLFWDYKSYFSVKNLDCFRLTPLRDRETVTALYPVGLDSEKVVSIIRDELEKAKAEQAKLIAERLEKKRKMLRQQSTRKGDGN